MNQSTVIHLEGITRSFGPIRAVDGLSLHVDAGETVAILGANGAGKSTTIAILLGLLDPDTGAVQVLGRRPREAVTEGLVGAMLQDAGLMPGVRVGELLDFCRHLFPRPLPAAELVAAAGLEEILNRRADRLSGGQAQRVRFAMAMAGDPSLIVLDEPTAAMDVEARRAFWGRMGAFAAAGRTILFATHHLEEADMAADRILVVAHGRLVADGSAAEIKSTVASRRVRLTMLNGDTDRLPGLAGVRRVELIGTRATLHTEDSDATVRDLAARDLRWRDLEVETGDLEEAFVSLTGGAAR